MAYGESVKARMVRRMLGPDRVSGKELADETGISRQTLSRWRRGAVSIKCMPTEKPSRPETVAVESTPGQKRPQDFSALERAQFVVEASRASEMELGELLRRNGLHREHLEQWREALEEALGKTGSKRSRGEVQRIRELEKELRRKEKALAEAAALLVLQKKVQALWGDGDDDTDDKSDK
jgi:transcriptional regulator with XRE-family HTH domain